MKTSEFYELSFDKFGLKVPKGYWFAGYDTWAKVDGNQATVGITDFLQTKMGDVAFFTPSEDQVLEQDDVLGTIESIKATIDLTMPVSGRVVEYNPRLKEHPEVISEDPYGDGWIVKVELSDWEADRTMLLPADKYFELMQEKVKNALAD